MKKEVGHITITIFLDDETQKEDFKIESDKNLPADVMAKILRVLAIHIETRSKNFSEEIERRH